MSLELSIDRASRIAGSQRALAEAIGAQEQHVSNWKRGTRPCPIAQRMRIAHMAGEEPIRAAIEGLIEQLDTTDEIQAGAMKGLQAILAAFPTEGTHRDESENPKQEGQQGVAQ